jgi:hypothetical protein
MQANQVLPFIAAWREDKRPVSRRSRSARPEPAEAQDSQPA